MNENCTTISTDLKKVTIKSIIFSKLHSKYVLAIKEKDGKIILEKEEYRLMINKFGTYTGHWRGKIISVDKNYKIVEI